MEVVGMLLFFMACTLHAKNHALGARHALVLGARPAETDALEIPTETDASSLEAWLSSQFGIRSNLQTFKGDQGIPKTFAVPVFEDRDSPSAKLPRIYECLTGSVNRQLRGLRHLNSNAESWYQPAASTHEFMQFANKLEKPFLDAVSESISATSGAQRMGAGFEIKRFSSMVRKNGKKRLPKAAKRFIQSAFKHGDSFVVPTSARELLARAVQYRCRTNGEAHVNVHMQPEHVATGTRTDLGTMLLNLSTGNGANQGKSEDQCQHLSEAMRADIIHEDILHTAVVWLMEAMIMHEDESLRYDKLSAYVSWRGMFERDVRSKICGLDSNVESLCSRGADQYAGPIIEAFQKSVQTSGDVLRTSVMVDEPQDVSTVVHALVANFQERGWKVAVENLWEPPIRPSGYVAVHMSVLVCGKEEAGELHTTCPDQFSNDIGNGMSLQAFSTFPAIIAELQVHLRAIMEAKEQAHVAYEFGRKQPDGSEMAKAADAACLAMFTHALHESFKPLPISQRPECH